MSCREKKGVGDESGSTEMPPIPGSGIVEEQYHTGHPGICSDLISFLLGEVKGF